MKRVTRIGLGVVVAVVAAVAISLWVFDWNMLRSPVASYVATKLHRNVAIDGDLDVHLSWTPYVQADDIVLGNVAWGSQQEMLTIERLSFRVDLSGILRGNSRLMDVTLVKPRLLLERAADGRANWQFGAITSSARAPLSIDGVTIEDGVVRYLDAVLDADVKVDVRSLANAAAGASKTGFSGSGRFRNEAFTIEGEAAPLLSLRDRDTPYALDVRASAGNTKVHYDGTFVPSDIRNLDGDLTLEGSDLSKLYPIVPAPLPWTPPYHLAGHLRHANAAWLFEPLNGKVGDSDLAGSFAIDNRGDKPMVKANLESGLLDVKDLGGFVGLPPKHTPAPARTAEQNREAARRAQSGRVLPDARYRPEHLRAADMHVTFRRSCARRRTAVAGRRKVDDSMRGRRVRDQQGEDERRDDGDGYRGGKDHRQRRGRPGQRKVRTPARSEIQACEPAGAARADSRRWQLQVARRSSRGGAGCCAGRRGDRARHAVDADCGAAAVDRHRRRDGLGLQRAGCTDAASRAQVTAGQFRRERQPPASPHSRDETFAASGVCCQHLADLAGQFSPTDDTFTVPAQWLVRTNASTTPVTADAGEVPLAPVLSAGHNCWRIEHANRLAFLVDGEAYFAAIRAAIASARHSIFILGWDIDSRMRLVPQGADDGYPEPLGEFLNAIVRDREDLHAYILAWDFAMLYAFEREWLPVYQFDWKTHRRLSFKLDNQHPLGGCHHQKIVVVDDDVALLGGFDLTRCRWDTSLHECKPALRVDTSGHAYGPFHDVGAMVDGNCARALGELARERWRRATGRLPETPMPAAQRAWPASVAVDLCDVDVAIARTEPAFGESTGVTEVRQLHVDAIASAQRSIFAENQYFTSRTIADAFARRLAAIDGPEIALVMPANQSGWLETSTMGVLRARIHRKLRAADAQQRYRLYCPTLPWQQAGDQCLNVHSKLMIVDDELLTLGSANLSERSQSLDTECNIAIEARGDKRVSAAIAALRERLLAEHLGVHADDVAAASADEPSLHRAIDKLGAQSARRLCAFDPVLDPAVDALTPDYDILDPEKSLDPDVVVADLLPRPERRNGVQARLAAIVVLVLALAALALAWRYTPLAGAIDFDKLTEYADALSDSPLAPLGVALAYVVGGLLVIPLTLLIGVTAIAFGPLLGSVYAIVGALLSASLSYLIGRRLGHDVLRKLAGRRLNTLSQRLGRRGLLAMVVMRLLPIAPYSIVNVVAGASHIGWRDFLLGTAIGLLPGVLGIMLFVDRAVTAIRHPGPVTFAVLAAVVLLVVLAGWTVRKWLIQPSQSAATPADAHAVAHAD